MYTSGFDSKLQNLSQIDITKNAEENYISFRKNNGFGNYRYFLENFEMGSSVSLLLDLSLDPKNCRADSALYT